jgi:predicted membrane protein
MTPQTPRSPKPATGALILIAIGALLFIDNLNLFPLFRVRALWPLVLSAWGVSMLMRPRRSCSLVWPWTLIAFGILLTLGNLRILPTNMRTIWPIFLIAAGVSMLFRRGLRGDRTRARCFAPRGQGISADDEFSVHAVFGAVNRRIDSPNFEGADLSCFCAELKVDLRGATISTPNREAILETHAAFGAIKLRVPETWKVLVQGNAAFGAIEDKTVPPRPVPGVDTPVLIIRGSAAFGAVEIEN